MTKAVVVQVVLVHEIVNPARGAGVEHLHHLVQHVGQA